MRRERRVAAWLFLPDLFIYQNGIQGGIANLLLGLCNPIMERLAFLSSPLQHIRLRGLVLREGLNLTPTHTHLFLNFYYINKDFQKFQLMLKMKKKFSINLKN